ncbi:helix-turn-helix domain-containing protein [Photobacterium kasasachensis]|uniref:helix-turn-helix domain-containing protein n=1 Tax=Photobacterium kasasachensis TaxID=2910240 RepID=UPI003D0EF448
MVLTTEKRKKLQKIALTEKVEETEKQFIVTKGQARKTSLAEGHFISYSYANAISLHGGNSTELTDSNIISTAPSTLIIIILLKGKLSFGFDDMEFDFDASQEPCAVVVNLAKPANFRRTLLENNQVAKLNISIQPNWIKDKISEDCPISDFIASHKTSFPIKLTEEMLELATEIIACHTPQSINNKLKLECLAHQLIGDVFEQLADMPKPPKSLAPPTDYTQIEDIVSYIETHLDQDLSLEQLAKTFSMSVSNLQRRFKHSLNLTIKGYIRYRRLEIAKQHLESGLIGITEAAYEAGYHHPSNFTNAFKRTFGVPPHAIARA